MTDSDPPPVTVSRPGSRPPEAELLETREPRRPVPGWAVFAAVMAVLLVLVGVNAEAGRRERARELAAADRFDVRIVPGGTGTTYGEGLLQLQFAIDNRGAKVRFGDPVLESSAFTLLPGPPPNPVAVGGAGVFLLRLRPDCAEVARLPAAPALRLRLPVIPPSGRVHLVPVEVQTGLLVALSVAACARVPTPPP